MSQYRQVGDYVRAINKRRGGDFAAMNDHEKTLVSAWAVYGLVGNMGFGELFVSPSAYLLAPSLKAFAEIGADKSAKIIKKLLAILGTSSEADEDSRLRALRSMSSKQLEQLDALTREFNDDPDDMVDRVLEFIEGKEQGE